MQRMLGLKALKPHLYGTRRLEAGDEYEAPAERAIAMVAERKADFLKGKPKAPAKVEETPDPLARFSKPDETPDLNALRLQATQLGIDIDGRWGAQRLQQEIEARRR